MAVNRDKVIASAEKLVAKGKIEPAIKEYERLLDDNPNDVNTLNRIGDLWVRINRTDEAVRVFSRIADHYSRDGFFLKAIAIYKKINKLDPSKLDIYAKLADLYAKQGLAMEAKSQYQILADYHLKHGDPNNALLTYRKIADLDPNSINVHVKLADLYSQNNRTEEALKEYDRVGKMLLKRGMLDEAVQVFKKALKIDPRNLDLAESLVTTLIEARDYKNSIQILETSLDANRANPRLIALLARTHIARGDLSTAQSILESALAVNPKDDGIRELLGEIHLRQGRPDESLEMVAPVVDSALNRGDGKTAVELLNRILRAEPSHAPTLEKLVIVYSRVREETNILAAMNSLAEAHIARKNFDAAAGVLRQLVSREPENAQHREKLAFVQQYASRPVPAAPAPPAAPPAPPPSRPPAAPPETFSFDEESLTLPHDLPELEIELDDSEPVEISFESTGAAAAPFLQEEAAETAEDLDFITEHLTEADVFAKYGLTEKAIEHLEAVLGRSPGHPGAFERLLRIHLDEGDSDAVARTAEDYIEALREKGELVAVSAVEQLVISRGFSLSPGQPEPAIQEPPEFPAGKVAFTSATQELLLPDELAPDFGGPSAEGEVEIDLEAMPFEEIRVVPAGSEPIPEETLGEPAEVILPEVIEPAEEIEEIESVEEIPAEEISAEEFVQVSEEPFYGMESVRPADWGEEIQPGPAVEELGEIDFYLEQDLVEEAHAKLNELLVRFPNSSEVRLRLERLSEPGEVAKAPSPSAPPAKIPEPPTAAPPPAAPDAQVRRPVVVPPYQTPVFSAADIENELLSAIPDEEEDAGILARPPSAQPAAGAAPPVDEGNLFAEEDDFFDLAAELEEELEEEQEEVLSLSEEEQSLEQIFKEFKKGVEQQLDSEDYDTHYNLGIAYKEMGLIDEAIGEFQLASKDPKRTIECCSMLGLCFLEKGMPQLAIKWYGKGLEAPEITEEEHLGLLYDLGSTYVEIGDTENAHKAFLEVYGANTNYRDIVERIKQLEDVQH